MSEFIVVNFQSRECDIKTWETIFESLMKGRTGAEFQERMAVYGDEVDSELERIIEDENYGPDAFNLSGWYEENGKYILEFDFPDDEFIKELHLLFSKCPVTELSVIR